MSNEEGQPLTFSGWVAKRVRAVRKARGWSVKDLAARCQQVGCPELTEGALYVLEGPRPRKVTGEEWLALALALDVPPLILALPAKEDASYAVTPACTSPASDVANWIMHSSEPIPERNPASGERLPWTRKQHIRCHRYITEWYESLSYLRGEEMFTQERMPAEFTGPEVDELNQVMRRVVDAAVERAASLPENPDTGAGAAVRFTIDLGTRSEDGAD